MTEVLFYHLQNMSLESVLPPLLEKSLERGWRVVVQTTSRGARRRARCASVDLPRRFVPAARAPGATAMPPTADHPRRSRTAIRTGANVRFLIDSAALPADADSL